jgi:hypothetical protein
MLQTLCRNNADFLCNIIDSRTKHSGGNTTERWDFITAVSHHDGNRTNGSNTLGVTEKRNRFMLSEREKRNMRMLISLFLSQPLNH